MDRLYLEKAALKQLYMHSYIEISKSSLLHNYNLFRTYLPTRTKIMCVLKGNAYGRGLEEVVKILNTSADYFMVDTIDELRRVRKLSILPTFVLGYLMESELEEAILLNADLTVHNLDRLLLIDKIAGKLHRKPKVHIELDALFGRMGLFYDELPELLQAAKKLKNVEIFAVYAHLSCTTDRENNVHDKKQIDLYESAVKLFKQHGFTSIKKHLFSTPETVLYEHGQSDFVRIGAALYGMWPSSEIKTLSPIKNLKPIARWVSHLAQVKNFPASYPIGYGQSYITKKKTKIGIIPQGWGDGFGSMLSNTGEVLIHGKRCKVVGSVCMNMFMVDLSEIQDAKPEDEVVIMGKQGEEEIFFEEIAELMGLLYKELIPRLNPLLPRVIVD